MAFPLGSILLLVLLVCFLRQDLTEEDRVSGQPGPGIHLSPAPQSYDCRLVLLYPVLNMGFGESDCPSIIHIFPLSYFFFYVFHSLVYISMDNAFQNTPSRTTYNCYENYFYFCYCYSVLLFC